MDPLVPLKGGVSTVFTFGRIEDYADAVEQARAEQVESIAAKRLGLPGEFGATCAFVCSAHAGFMSGMNIHLDGGSYPALV